MALRFSPRDLRDRPWLTAGLLCLALLFIPTVAWIWAPHAGGFAAPPPARRTGAVAAAESEPEEAEAADEARPAAAPERPGADPKGTADEVEEEAVRGIVVDPDGKPVWRAAVVCLDKPKEHEYATVSDREGRFKLSLAADGCKAVARHAEYAPASEVRVYKGKPNEIRMKAGGRIEGTVVDERGTGVSPVMVAVESFTAATNPDEAPRNTGRASSFEARNGSFTLEKLAPGKYVLTASSEGRPPAHSDAIDVEAGRTVRGIKIVLPKGGKLAGKVVDADTKKPVSGAIVSLDSVTSSQANAIKSATTDDRGAFALDGVPGGPFSIRVAHLNYKTKIVSSLTSSPGGAATPIEVEISGRGDGGAETELSGVGVQILFANGGVQVFWVDPGGPAATAGVLAMDQLLKIDGVDVKDLTISDCTQRLRGAAGTKVVMTVDRAGGPLDLMVTRADLKVGR